jgi:Leucine-rich repeat (LRR) protein
MSATDKKNATAKLEAIEAINREPSFSPEVKQALIEAYMEEDISVEEAQSKTVGFIVGSNSEPNAEDATPEAAAKRQAIATIYQSTSLSPTEKHKAIQALLGKGKEEPARENKVGAQGRAVQAIYRDDTLSPQEKHERVQALMKGEDYESVKAGSKPSASAIKPRRPRPSLDYVRMARNHEYSESGDSISQLEDQESLFRDEISRGTTPTRSTKASTRASKSRGSINDRKGSSETEPKTSNSLKEVVIDIDSLSDISDGGNSRRKLYLCVVLSVILFWAIVGPLLYKYLDDNSGKSTESTPIRGSDVTLAPIADPTYSPTEFSLYDPPTTTQCVRIGQGNGVYGQDSMLTKTFNVDIDLTLNLGTSNISPMVKTLTEKIQEILAPALAGCINESPAVSTQGIRGNGRRKLVREYVVANVIIEAEHQDMESCSPVASGACFRVVAELTLFLKGYETNLHLINHIASVFGKSKLVDELQLSAPFQDVEVVNVAASALTTDAPTTSPTLAPTLAPTIPATPAPTTSQPTKRPTPWPTMAPTNQPSVSPTISHAPTMTRRTHVQQSLRNIDSTNVEAFDWLVNDDFWVPSDWAPPSGEGFWIDRYVLASLYFETGERRWTVRNGWVASTSHCNWYGVSCDSSGRVTAVQLSDNNMEGAIPTALSLIQNLQILDLGMNSLSGAIPAELELMSNMKTLNLQSASLTGYFPDWIGNMASLERLYLNNNDFIGTIPSQIGFLTNINTLSLGTFGVLKSILYHSSLSNFFLLTSAGNEMTGTLPTSFKHCTNMRELDLCK